MRAKLLFQHLSRFGRIAVLLFLTSLLAGCAATSRSVITESLPSDAIKAHKFVRIRSDIQAAVNTGIKVAQGDYVSIIATGEMIAPRMHSVSSPLEQIFYPDDSLTFKIGQDGREYRLTQVEGFRVKEEGIIYLDYLLAGLSITGRRILIGSFDADIIVWKRYDPIMVANYFQEVSKKDPKDRVMRQYAENARRAGELYQAEMIAKSQADETRTALAALQVEKPTVKAVPEKKSEAVDLEKEWKTAELTEKLKKAEQTQKELEALKEREREQRAREQALFDRLKETERNQQNLVAVRTKDLELKEAQKDKRIAELSERLGKAEQLQKEMEEFKKKMEEQRAFEGEILARLKAAEARQEIPSIPPMIAITSPRDGTSVDVDTITFTGAALSERGIARVDMLVNRQPHAMQDQRGLQVLPKAEKEVQFSEKIRLQEGRNEISVVVHDSKGLIARKTIAVQFDKKKQTVWAAIIGISRYQNTPSLKYASRDAREFYRLLTDINGVPKDHVWMLLDEQATLPRIRSLLGTQLRRNASKDDLVIIYIAGHGATEKDSASQDGDGLEKYFLPSEVDPKDYYASAMPMGEVARILGRISSERLVFISDTCYSGASGGRTIPTVGVRSNVSGAFLERLSQGKGRIIITASDANEVSVEKDELGHGVFTYYLLEGLRGAADFDKNGAVTVDEVYRYVSLKVPQATGQDQHPVKKGETTGEIVMSIVK